MATKKEATTEKDTTTIAAKAAQKLGKEILTANPEMKEVHVTSDGVAFFTRNDAQNHAHTLKNREVHTLTRAALFGTAKKAAAKTESADNGNAGEDELQPGTENEGNDNPENDK